jgi:pimeloyl-ACP methyl ester carboxylesterase
MIGTALTSMTIAGVELLVRDGAPDATVVLLHGIGGRASSFAEVMRRWPAGPRVLAWDQPGYGASANHPAAWPTPQDYGTVLLRVLDDLGVAKVDLIGQSLGGLIAATFSAAHPARMARLVLVSPAHGYSTPVGGPLPELLAQRIADFQKEGAEAFATKRAPRLVFEADRHAAVTAAVRATMATLTDPGHSQAVKVLASGTIAATLAAIPRDVLLVSGVEDVITPLAGTRALYDLLAARSGATAATQRLHVIPRAGHAAYLEAPDVFVQAVSTFLRGDA